MKKAKEMMNFIADNGSKAKKVIDLFVSIGNLLLLIAKFWYLNQ